MMKAVVKALELVRQMAGRIKAVAIYTDSTSALNNVGRSHHALGKIIISKARLVTKLGATISLHWCPGHSKVSVEHGVQEYRRHSILCTELRRADTG